MNLEVLAKQYEQTSENLKAVQNQLQEFGEKAQKDLNQMNALSEKTTEKVDNALSTISSLQNDMRNMEQVLAEAKTKQSGDKVMSLAEIARNDEAFTTGLAAMVANGGRGTAVLDLKNAVTSILPDGANFAGVQRLAGIQSPMPYRLTVRDLLSWGTTRSNAIEFLRESGFVNNADFVKENPTNPKPESDITFESDIANVQTIAHWIPAPKQVLDDVAMLTSYLSGRLIDGLKLKEEQALLYGTGSGVTIKGINTQASAFNTTALGSLLNTDSTAIDKLRVALLQAELAGHSADAIMLNPIDWAGIELLKENSGAYLYSNPHVMTTPVLWGKKVVGTQTITNGNYLVGAFAFGAMGWDREVANVRVSTENSDNFVKNMVTILCEERLGLTVFRPEAFVKGTL